MVTSERAHTTLLAPSDEYEASEQEQEQHHQFTAHAWQSMMGGVVAFGATLFSGPLAGE